jgi:uncharacterized iron-regulated protein
MVELALAGCASAPRTELVEAAGTHIVERIPAAAARAPVVLLGEQHDSAADHRWQLAVIRTLYAEDPSMILGFEMFPRAAQPALNAWVAGQLSEDAFLQRTDWAHVWGFPPELYMPIFRFARDHRVPMLALNVSHQLVHLVAKNGWAGVPLAAREGVGTPAPASAAYRATLQAAMGEHGRAMPPEKLDHFIDAQLLWDRAMAEAIAAQHGRRVVALMGGGHLENLQGVPRQLAALGVAGVVALLRSE